MRHSDDAALRRMEEELGEITGTGEAAGGLVRAVTGPSGRLLDIVFDPRVMRLDSHELAREVGDAVRRAQEDGERRARELVDGTLGPAESGGAPGEPLDHARFWDGLGRMRQDFERSMAEQEAELARRLGNLGRF
ncbi:YbaB/EbfC family nucleoid-associated protein [Streptosporangium pseudovulgare]|uniref:YbaB/EbfC family DNA-binding protein n=1 Tax=Streptosporangium pseudovulgare TaxID=35765 RepID=A0ABQ2QX74_9ACTN|nr:YbaB/EbfC family nucleoid-associated protein [Streptosporangium pseudovulgare]GGP98247.1 hypothetical protein GCM10010140_30560 [Streptosporangium pseudovulgare]